MVYEEAANMSSPLLLNVLISTLLLTTTANAADHVVSPNGSDNLISNNSGLSALSPAQITAIRSVGRNVLTAKNSQEKSEVDTEMLEKLRSNISQLIAIELAPENRAPITVQNQKENAAEHPSRTAFLEQRKVAHANARKLVGQIKDHAGSMIAHATESPKKDEMSAGFPIGTQRSELLERLAKKLETALAEGNPDSLSQLHQLQNQLNTTQRGLSDVPLAHGTPTLQAMPAGFVSSENTDPAEAKE
jgi:hypothetical protein